MATPPYSFTNLPAYAFDQVLSFTNMNILRLNQENTKDSYSEEHEFSSGEHGRIKMGQNLVMNPTGRRGLQFWDSVWTAQSIWTNSAGHGAFWNNTSDDGSLKQHKSIKIVAAPSIPLVLSFETFITITTRVSGSFGAQITCFDAGDVNLGGIAVTTVTASEADWTPHEATGITLANTAYIIVTFNNDLSATAVALNLRSVKVENGTVATAYSDESSMPQYLSARYTLSGSSETGFIATGALTIIDFDLITFDDPGADRVSPDDGGANRWRYTADRYQKLRVSAHLRGFLASALGAGESITVELYKNGVLYSELYFISGDVIAIPGTLKAVTLNGTDIIELDRGDYFDVRLTQDSGGNFSFSLPGSYIAIEEIS